MFDEFDHGGKIKLSDFRDEIVIQHENLNNSLMRQAFKKFDSDDSGSISREEM